MNFFEAKIIKTVKETSDTYSYIMETPEGFAWKAGQHAMFKFKDYDVADEKKERIFTIASAPEDGFLMFTTRISPEHTDFKEILLNKVKVGDVMLIADALGKFDLEMDKYDETLIIAGGVGITPIRSLLKHYAQDNVPAHRITLLYSDDRGEFAYGELWNELKAQMTNLQLHLISDRDEFTSLIDKYAKEKLNTSEYLIAGSPGMNAAIFEKLQSLGVEKDNIKTDNFMGY